MPIELVMVPVKHAMVPATDHDAELMRQCKGPMKFTAVKQSARSLQHHRLYWGGLLRLTFDYWEPDTGLLSPSEIATLNKFSRWLDAKSGNSGAISTACDLFMSELRQSRASKIETPQKSIQELHEWVKVEAGHFELVMTPAGIKKKSLSINFNAMSQEQFNDYYKRAFSVCWRLVLSRTFESEQQADTAINELMMMG